MNGRSVRYHIGVRFEEFELDERDLPQPALPAPSRPPKPPLPAVIHADAEILVIDKPAGVLSVPGRGDHSLLADVLRERKLVPEDEPFRVVHRLDLDASGVIVFARTLGAQQSLTRQFENRTVEKVYLALVRGYVAEDGEVNLPLKADDGGSKAKVSHKHGKAAVTRFRILERVAGHTLLEVRPQTGRLHQIRIHMTEIGHPLGVDPLYDGPAELRLSAYKSGYKQSTKHEERPLIARLTLHAASISFDHPDGTGRVSLASELPKDFRATLKQLRRA